MKVINIDSTVGVILETALTVLDVLNHRGLFTKIILSPGFNSANHPVLLSFVICYFHPFRFDFSVFLVLQK
ncbi:TPA: hypothetical protein ACQN2Y_000520 [Streptococcus pyogenes]